MPVPDYDNTLLGQYIRAIENPDSVGYSPITGRWYAPVGSGYDKNSRGMGIDIAKNENAAPLVKRREGKWLSEQEERNLRNQVIQQGLGYIEKYKSKIPASRNMSPEMEAMAMGAIYRGDGPYLWKTDNPLGKAYYTGDTETFGQALQEHYKKKGVPDRAEKHNNFWKRQRTTKPTSVVQNMKDAVDAIKKQQNIVNQWGANWQNRLDQGGQIYPNPLWNDLSIKEKSAYIKTAVRNGITKLQDIRQAYNEFAKGGTLSDSEYIGIMEKVAKDNWQKWGDESEDMALLRILNDNSYNYREYYNNNPEGAANADTHWPDTYKTYYHPTFSDESIYSGKVSDYNPTGAVGGHWIGDIYIPKDAYHYGSIFTRPFSQGGNIYDGWTMPSQQMQSRIANWEGKAMTQSTIDPLSHKRVKKNASFKDAAKGFISALPTGVREQVLANPELADWLYSYSYNVGAGRFKERVVPALQRYYSGNGSVEDIQQSMWATGDKKLRGLANRRARERAGVQDALWDTEMQKLNAQINNPSAFTTPTFDYIPLSEALAPDTGIGDYTTSIVDNTSTEETPVEETTYQVSPWEKMLAAQSMMNTPVDSTPAFMPTQKLSAPFVAKTFGEGGGIHIKPSHRGRLTELKARTGKTEAELYNDGNPTHKKMVVFARNARKFKHADGGPLNLFYPGGDTNNENAPWVVDITNVGLGAEKSPNYYVDRQEPLEEVVITGRRPTKDYLTMSNDATVIANGREYNPHLMDRAIRGGQANALWEREHPNLTTAMYGLNAVPFAVATAPAWIPMGDALASSSLGTGLAALATNPYVDAAGISMGLTDAGQKLYNGQYGKSLTQDAMTALELTPLGYGIGKGVSNLRNFSDRVKPNGNDALYVNDRNVLNESNIESINPIWELPLEERKQASQRMLQFIYSPDYERRIIEAGDAGADIRNIIESRINDKDYFPAYTQRVINNDNTILGKSVSWPNEGDLSGITIVPLSDEVKRAQVLDHEVAHYSTKDIGIGGVTKEMAEQSPIGNGAIQKVLQYDETAFPRRTFSELQKLMMDGSIPDMTFERLAYLDNTQEKRARAYAMWQEAKRRGISTDELVDLYTKDNLITKDAPDQLRDLGMLYSPKDLKNFLNKFLTPIGIMASATLYNNKGD